MSETPMILVTRSAVAFALNTMTKPKMSPSRERKNIPYHVPTDNPRSSSDAESLKALSIIIIIPMTNGKMLLIKSGLDIRRIPQPRQKIPVISPAAVVKVVALRKKKRTMV